MLLSSSLIPDLYHSRQRGAAEIVDEEPEEKAKPSLKKVVASPHIK